VPVYLCVIVTKLESQPNSKYTYKFCSGRTAGRQDTTKVIDAIHNFTPVSINIKVLKHVNICYYM